MEWTKPSNLPPYIKETFMNQMLEINFTEWEDDDPEADESITEFSGSLVGLEIEENRFQGYDLTFRFEAKDQQGTIEIIMDFPTDDEDLVAQSTEEDNTLQLFGNDSTLVLKKGL